MTIILITPINLQNNSKKRHFIRPRFKYFCAKWAPVNIVCLLLFFIAGPTLSQCRSFKIRRATFQNCVKFTDLLIARLQNCERASRSGDCRHFISFLRHNGASFSTTTTVANTYSSREEVKSHHQCQLGSWNGKTFQSERLPLRTLQSWFVSQLVGCQRQNI